MGACRQLVAMFTASVLVSTTVAWAVLQDSPLAGTLAAASPEVETFVREALHNRLVAGDIPDIGLVRRADGKPVYVRADLPASRTRITSRALPSVPNTEFVLMTLAEAQGIANRTGQPLFLLAVDHVRLDESTATTWLGVDLIVPPGAVQMCCCEREAHFRRRDDRWVFERWVTGGRCY